MRSRILTVTSAVLFSMAMASPAAAGSSGEDWDDSHMLSRYRSVLSVPRPPKEVRGGDRYGSLADEPVPAPRNVPETLPTTTQRSWESGSRGSARVRASSRSGLSTIQSSGRGGSSGGRSASRGSSLRSGVTGSASR